MKTLIASLALAALTLLCATPARAHDCAQPVVTDHQSQSEYLISCKEYTLRKGGKFWRFLWKPSHGLLCGVYDTERNALAGASWKVIPLQDPQERAAFTFSNTPQSLYFFELKDRDGMRGPWYLLEVKIEGAPPWRALVKRAEDYMLLPYCPQYLSRIDPLDLGSQERLTRFDQDRWPARAAGTK